MEYNAHIRNIIGTIGFFCLGLLIGGFAPMIAVIREWLQYKKNSVLETGDLWRYVIASSCGSVIQMIVVFKLLIKIWLN